MPFGQKLHLIERGTVPLAVTLETSTLCPSAFACLYTNRDNYTEGHYPVDVATPIVFCGY